MAQIVSVVNPAVSIQLSEGETNLYPQMKVYDDEDVLIKTVTLVSKGAGKYSTDLLGINSGLYVLQFFIYSDSGHTTLSNNYGIVSFDIQYQDRIRTDYALTENLTIEIEQITDYSTNLRLLLEQYKNSENLKGILDLMNDQADDFETAIFEIRDNYWLSSAIGVQLDVIGSIFRETRKGRSDADYRIAIGNKATQFFKSGEPESIIMILVLFYSATYVYLKPSWPGVPAGYYVETDAVVTSTEMEPISAAGVQPYILWKMEFEDGNLVKLQDGSQLYGVS